jgi:hypothetical protein
MEAAYRSGLELAVCYWVWVETAWAIVWEQAFVEAMR